MYGKETVARSTLTSKSQTTVPKEIREKLGIGPGDVLEWEMADGEVRVLALDSAFLRRRGSVRVGPGSAVEDVKLWRRRRGRVQE
jgi:AbrB family looped-hinge helix DNA binding protein